MDQYARRIIGFGVHAGTVDGTAPCCMFHQVIQGHPVLPKYLSSDHDPLFLFERWQANLRILDIVEIKTEPYVPVSHPFVERLIGFFVEDNKSHFVAIPVTWHSSRPHSSWNDFASINVT
jgi:hypothetical protein